MAERRRLLLSCHTFLPTVGGAELGVHELARRLGEDHDVIVLAPGDPTASTDYEPNGYRVVRVTRVRGGRRGLLARLSERTGWAYARALVRLHRARPVDAVNCHFVKRHALLIAVARLLKIRVVLSLAGRSDVLADLPRGRRLWTESVIRGADEVVANSAYYLRGSALASRAHVVPYGVDLGRFAPGPDERAAARASLGLRGDDFVCLAVQRLDPVKRVDLLIRMLAVARMQHDALTLLVCGTGVEAERLEQLACELGVEDSVVFAGYVPEARLPAMYGLADTFVTHSESETFGLTFTEAMAAGLPIIAADTSCIPDVLATDTAVIVDAGDVAGFARAVIALAADPEDAHERGRRGRSRAEREYDWDAIARRYAHLLGEPSSVHAQRAERRPASHAN